MKTSRARTAKRKKALVHLCLAAAKGTGELHSAADDPVQASPGGPSRSLGHPPSSEWWSVCVHARRYWLLGHGVEDGYDAKVPSTRRAFQNPW